MKLASYTATHSGFSGIFNRAIRWRFGGSFLKDGQASHTEVVFMPGDGVDHLMPDGNCAPVLGAYWCASSSALDIMPAWSSRRVGKKGGVRFKRIVLDPNKWEIADYNHDPVYAAEWFRRHQGLPYDWSTITGYLSMPLDILIGFSDYRWMCSAACAAAGGYSRADLFHPELLRLINRNHELLMK